MGMHEIVICSNTETVCSGQDWPDEWEEECAREFVGAAIHVVLGSRGPVDYDTSASFAAWNGGTHYKCGGRVGSIAQWGYSAGLVVCHTQDTPAYIKSLCDRAYDAGFKAADEFARTQANSPSTL